MADNTGCYKGRKTTSDPKPEQMEIAGRTADSRLPVRNRQAACPQQDIRSGPGIHRRLKRKRRWIDRPYGPAGRRNGIDGCIFMQIRNPYPGRRIALRELCSSIFRRLDLIETNDEEFLDRTGVQQHKAHTQHQPGDLSAFLFSWCESVHLTAKVNQNGSGTEGCNLLPGVLIEI